MVSSYVLLYENSKNPNAPNKKTILRFVTEYTDIYVDIDRSSEIKRLAEGIVATGVKTVDAEHVACAILAGCEYFLTTDDRLLKYKTGQIKIMDPTEFIRNWEVQE